MLVNADFKRLGATLVLLFIVQIAALSATLTHRYSFDSDASDSVGGANGVLQGNAVISNGALVLDGTNASVQLPNDLLRNYDSASIEVWYVDETVSSPTAQLYTFSGTNGGLNYLLFGESLCFVGASSNVVILPVPAIGKTNHLVWTQDAISQTGRLYVNGALAGESTNFTFTPAMMGSTTTNYIGRGRTNSTAVDFKGRIFEFRIYQNALNPSEIAVLDAFGPDQAQSNPGTLESVRLVPPSQVGPGALFRANVFADFSGITNVNISTQPDLVLQSDNTNVVAVAADQRLQSKSVGTANLTAVWQNVTNTVVISVVVPQDVALIHRYTFNEKTNDWIVHDSVGDAHGRVFSIPLAAGPLGGTIPSTAFSGSGELKFAVGASYQFYGGYVKLPPGIVSSISEISIEAWVTWTQKSSWPWQRIFDFGSASGTRGQTYFFLTTEANTFVTNGDVARATIATSDIYGETPRLDWTNTLPLNVTSFVAVTYSPVRGITTFYINGQAVASGVAVIPLSAIVDTNNFLGRSQYTQDSYYCGRFDEFRIYAGLLSASDVQADFAAGPNKVGTDYSLHTLPATNGLTITWGKSATNLNLFSSPVIGPGGIWTAVDSTPMLQNERYRVTIPLTNDAGFFRLQSP